MDRILRPTARDAAPGVHGSPDHGELERMGLRPGDILDFSANLNPYGPSPEVAKALAGVRIGAYPDRNCGELRKIIAEANQIDTDRITVGNGSSEIIFLLAISCAGSVLIAGPTYGEYERCAQIAGLDAHAAPVRSPGSAFSVYGLCEAIARRRPALTFLCNPNNPTGEYLDPDEVRALLDACRAAGGALVIDEAYVDFVDAPWHPIERLGTDNLVVLRSLTKLHGLAALRIGYAMGDARIIRALERVKPPWSVNSFAQAAGIAALRDADHLDRSRTALAAERDRLREEFELADYSTISSAASFFLVDVRDGATFRRALLARGILVRDCASFGLPAYVRISARTPEDGAMLEEALHAQRRGRVRSDEDFDRETRGRRVGE